MTYRRTLIALVLTAIAVALPSGAWLLAGRRQIEREHHLLEKGVYMKAQKKGVVHAERLATRFEVVRKSESRRPFYHYQNLFHDPEGASEGASVTVSPLAKGSPDPLIEAHFQVDDDGRLTLPTINDEFPELGLQSTDSAPCALLQDLRDVAYFCFGELDATAAVYGGEDRDDWLAGGEEPEEVVLSTRAWRQNLRANALYADLKYQQRRGDGAGELVPDANGGTVTVRVGPFSWHTLPVGEQLGLVALRQVETPVGLWTQGFVIERETVRQYLAHSDFPATFAPLPDLERGRHDRWLVQPVSHTSWGVAFDMTGALGEAILEAAADRDRFYRYYLAGAVAAVLAGLLVVAMVYQSERLALKRAQFAASAAHELRTPLAGLRLYGEMLAEGLGNPARARDYARRMAAEAERLGRVVTNVLSFTRLERKSLSVHPQSGDLAAAVRTALERQEPALREAGVALGVELPDDLPPAVFDRDAVDHIVQNLLDNAEKYTRGVDDRAIEVRLEPNGAGARLRIADNGPGVARDVRRRLFRPFMRGNNHDNAEGLGLGLVLVRVLARAQGGDISYRDRPGGGAEFTVTFAS
jgi:signal transduction histidine kinase